MPEQMAHILGRNENRYPSLPGPELIRLDKRIDQCPCLSGLFGIDTVRREHDVDHPEGAGQCPRHPVANGSVLCVALNDEVDGWGWLWVGRMKMSGCWKGGG